MWIWVFFFLFLRLECLFKRNKIFMYFLIGFSNSGLETVGYWKMIFIITNELLHSVLTRNYLEKVASVIIL